MTQALSALGNALRDLLLPRILAVVALPMVGALGVWVTLAWLFWDQWTNRMGRLAETAVGRWLEGLGAEWLLHAVLALGVIVLLVPAILITAMVITEIVAMPVIIAVVSGRHYPALEKRRGGTVAGSMLNAGAAIAVFALAWIATLPLWLFGIFAAVLPVLLSAYLTQRVLRYDALADHAGAEEYREVLARARMRLYFLGVLLALLYVVPVLNLLLPVLSGLAFAHLCLSELQDLRGGTKHRSRA